MVRADGLENIQGERIDIHAHIGGTACRRTGCYMSRAQRMRIRSALDFPRNVLYPILDMLGLVDAIAAKELLDEVNESVYDHVVVLAMDGVYDRRGRLDKQRTHYYVPNDYVFALAQKHKKLLPGASINPLRADAIDELERCAELGAVLIGEWIPNAQQFAPDDKKIIPFYRKAAELGMPILSHTGYEHTIISEDQSLGDPRRLRVALEEGVTVIAAHSGTSGCGHPIEYLDFFIDMLERYPNLYGDISSFTEGIRWNYLVRFASDKSLLARLVNGSDYPLRPNAQIFGRYVPSEKRREINKIKNRFNRDYEIKKFFGIPDSLFKRGYEVIRRAKNDA